MPMLKMGYGAVRNLRCKAGGKISSIHRMEMHGCTGIQAFCVPPEDSTACGQFFVMERQKLQEGGFPALTAPCLAVDAVI